MRSMLYTQKTKYYSYLTLTINRTVYVNTCPQFRLCQFGSPQKGF